jgi:hypothetical protein
VAFYPLFTLLMRRFTTLGMEVELAGVLIKTWAFLGGIIGGCKLLVKLRWLWAAAICFRSCEKD